jgi:uncharacterized membrane protein (GlpM family)
MFWYGLGLKMAMTVVIVVSASVAAERSGPLFGALVAVLPTAAGAAYIILAIEHPPDFIAASAVGSVAIDAAVSIFAAAYAILAQRHGLFVSLGSAVVLWFAVAAVLRMVDWTPVGAVALNAAVFAVTIPLTWRYRSAGMPPKVARSALDIPLRLVCLRNVRRFPDRARQLHRHHAAAGRRQGGGEGAGLRAAAADRAQSRVPRHALSGSAVRLVVGAGGGDGRERGVELRAVGG